MKKHRAPKIRDSASAPSLALTQGFFARIQGSFARIQGSVARI